MYLSMYLTHKSHEFKLVTYLTMFLSGTSHEILNILLYLTIKATN